MRTQVLEAKRLPVLDYTRLVENPGKFRLKNFFEKFSKNFPDGGIRKNFQKLSNFSKISTRKMFLRVYKHFWVFEKFLKILDFGPFEGSAHQGQKILRVRKNFSKNFLRVWKNFLKNFWRRRFTPPLCSSTGCSIYY